MYTLYNVYNVYSDRINEVIDNNATFSDFCAYNRVTLISRAYTYTNAVQLHVTNSTAFTGRLCDLSSKLYLDRRLCSPVFFTRGRRSRPVAARARRMSGHIRYLQLAIA